MFELILMMTCNKHKSNLIPLFGESISASFPSPAQDFIEKRIDLNELIIKHPSATRLLRASGEYMINGHISHEDLLIVDSSKEPKDGDIVVASIFGEFTVKKLYLREQAILQPMNPNYEPIVIKENQLEIFGVVTHVIHET